MLPPPRRAIESATVGRPPVPARRKTKNSGFWGVASSFGLDRVPGWGESDKDKDNKRVETEPEKRRFVAPPHPSSSPGPPRSNSPGPSSLGPPPLPSRNQSRIRKPVPTDSGEEGRRSSVTESSTKGSQSSASDRQACQESPVTVKPEESPTLCSLLVSSPEDADPSNEGFLTPSEDVAPPDAPSVSTQLPAPVPLPGSFHDTPVATSVVPEETNKTSTEPEPEPEPEAQPPESSKPAEPVIAHGESPKSEYVQPRPRPPPASTVRPVSPPSRTGSPGAPPLPRRAAARRAVPPRPPAAPPAPASPPPPVDARPTETAQQPNGHHVEQTEARATAEPDAKADIVPFPVVAPESGPPPSSEEPGNPPKEKDEEEKDGQADVLLPAAETIGSPVPETSGAEEEFVDAAGEAVEFSSDQPGEKPEQQQPEQQPQLPPRHKRPLSADSSTSHGDPTIETSAEGAGSSTPNDQDAEPPERSRVLEKMKMAAPAEEEEATEAPSPPLPPPRHPRPPPVRSTEQRRALSESTASPLGNVGVGKSDKSDKPAEPEYAPDGMPYVGDGTWEERTWKELTRLREDMFWARVGSTQ